MIPHAVVPPAALALARAPVAQAAAAGGGSKGLLDAGKAMAMTVVDLIANQGIADKVKDEFETK